MTITEIATEPDKNALKIISPTTTLNLVFKEDEELQIAYSELSAIWQSKRDAIKPTKDLARHILSPSSSSRSKLVKRRLTRSSLYIYTFSPPFFLMWFF